MQTKKKIYPFLALVLAASFAGCSSLQDGSQNGAGAEAKTDRDFEKLVRSSVKEFTVRTIERAAKRNRDTFSEDVQFDINGYSEIASNNFLQCFDEKRKEYSPKAIRIYEETVIESRALLAQDPDPDLHQGDILWRRMRKEYDLPDKTLHCKSENPDTAECRQMKMALEPYRLFFDILPTCVLPAFKNAKRPSQNGK